MHHLRHKHNASLSKSKKATRRRGWGTMTTKPRKHEELTAALQALAQTLAPGDRFPSHTELMRRFQVSDRTALRSLDELRRAGWIIRRNGVGTFVADPDLRTTAPSVAVSQGPSTAIAGLALGYNPYFSNCVEILTTHAIEAGLSAVFHYSNDEANFEDALLLEALRPRGFVIFSYTLAPIAQKLIERGHRTIVVGVPPAGEVPTIPCVYGDHEQGGYLAARHLLDWGHRRIAFAHIIPSSTHARPLHHTMRRWYGHQRALREAGVPDDGVINPPMVSAWRGDPQAMVRYFRGSDGPTAIAVFNDMEAQSLLRLFRRAGLCVPGDVSLVGYDAIAEGAEEDPPLDTVDQHISLQIRNALSFVSSSVDPTLVQTTIVAPTLIRRDSVAAPRS